MIFVIIFNFFPTGLQQLFRDLKDLVVNDSEHTTQVSLLAKKYNVSL